MTTIAQAIDLQQPQWGCPEHHEHHDHEHHEYHQQAEEHEADSSNN